MLHAELHEPAECFPWHQPLLAELMQQRQRNALHPALLLCAGQNAGRQRFATALAAQLLCLSPRDPAAPVACGKCRGCELFRADTHPDFYWLTARPDRKSIGVDDVRSLTDKLQLSVQLNGARVAVVESMELLTEQASNALLKSLEEPPRETFYLLLARSPGSVLPTVASRCQRVRLPLPDTQALQAWLGDRAAPEAVQAAIRNARGYPELAWQLLQGEAGALAQETLAEDVLAGRMQSAELAKALGDTDLALFVDALLLKLLSNRRAGTVPAGGGPGDEEALTRTLLDTKRSLRRSPNRKLLLDALCIRLGKGRSAQPG